MSLPPLIQIAGEAPGAYSLPGPGFGFGFNFDVEAPPPATPEVPGDRLPFGLLAGRRLDELWGGQVYVWDLPHDELWSFVGPGGLLVANGYAHYFGEQTRDYHTGLKLGVDFALFAGNQPQAGVEVGYVQGITRNLSAVWNASAQVHSTGQSEAASTLQLQFHF